MEWIALAVLLFFNFVGFIAIFFTSIGTFIILLGAIFFSLLTSFQVLTVPTLLLIFGLYLVGEVLEYILIILGAKRLGASNIAIVGALFGGFLGAVLGALGFGVGVIFGGLLGIFLGAFLVEMIFQRDLVRSLKAGAGSLMGRLGSIFVKMAIAGVIFAVMAMKVLPTLEI